MANSDLADVWARSLDGLADLQIQPHQRAWLKLTRPLGLVENTALIATPNEFVKEQLETRLRALITQALSQELRTRHPAGRHGRPDAPGHDARVRRGPGRGAAAAAVRTCGHTGPRVRPRIAQLQALSRPGRTRTPLETARLKRGGPREPCGVFGTTSIRPVPGGPGTVPQRSPRLGGTRLNSKYTFETFVIGSSNQFAHAAAVAVAEAPGQGVQPLFIYGDSGLGKTHLLHAIGHYAQALVSGG